ncbi:hypothetical protein SLS53_002881 [Cytospora paraplurivora]|uniref:Glycoprotease family protein n=1 Tax=Cytospora paraplurivora TaxID=2898453 RepID=A0AAN9YK60_9PEZI
MAESPLDRENEREEWEDWTDNELNTSLSLSQKSPSSKTNRHRSSKARQSIPKIQRVRSRKRQQAQNAKAGIRLVTDMTGFRKAPHHVVQLVKPAPDPHASQEKAAKFADASALRALEGSPSSASMGNWAWLKNSPSPSATPVLKGSTATPANSRIVIGFSLPEEDAAGRDISPQAAVVATPMDRRGTKQPSTNPFHFQHAQSAWSPDTEDGLSPSRHHQIASSIYSQSTGAPAISQAPPVPAVPAPFKNPIKARLSRNDVDDDDNFTPVTLFEEDGHKSPASTVSKISPETKHARSGWWNHVTTPFRERFSPASRAGNEALNPSADEWWKDKDEKTTLHVPQWHSEANPNASGSATILHSPPATVPVIRVPTPTVASSSRSPPPTPVNQQESHSEKARIMMEEDNAPTELPPPYEREPSSKPAQPVKYRAVFPPSNLMIPQFPLSPQPDSPGLDGGVAPMGGIKMTEVPLTPGAPLPDRPIGTYVPAEHLSSEVHENSPAAKVERKRRRHEKEEYYARRAGGFWRGRACFDGCYGRSGREGRQRRRVWLGVCLTVFLLLVALGVALGIVLSRRAIGTSHDTAPASTSSSSSASDSTGSPLESVWLNLTNFPPIPTGLATVVAPDNSEAIDGCVSPAKLWSCSLPPEQQAANEPHKANQPEFILQIHPSRTELATDSDSGLERRSSALYDTGIAPNPDPPSFDEMWFLGNTTDGIVSDEKAGEPTPFYISFFKNVSSSAGSNLLSGTDSARAKRGSGNGIGSGSDSSDSLSEFLPSPTLNEDGTGAAAQLRPYPFQQPLRLYDRGLPTEHYGFYVYFNKTIYLESMNNDTSSDSDGGSLETNADWLATWSQTRFIVKIWTQKGNSTRLLGGSGPSDKISSTIMPGTFPYPITVGEDTHGGDLDLKSSFAYAVEADQHINTTDATLFTNDIGYGGTVVNPRLPSGDLSWGGVDGGTGGCRCEWVNWVNNDGSTDESLS